MGASRTETRGTTSETREPWGPAAGAIRGAIPDIESLYQQRKGQEFFPGQTYAGFDPSQTEALGNIEGIARSGGGVTGSALGMVGDTLSGKYLDAGNPSFGLMAGRIRNEVQPQLTAQWSQAGRGTGNGAAPEAVSRGLGDAVGQLAYGDYRNERNNQFTAAGMAPGLDAARYADADRLWDAGGQRQGMDQNRINEQMMRYDFGQNRDSRALAERLGFLTPLAQLGGESSGTSSSTTTSRPSPLQTAAGLGMTAAGMYFGMPPGMMGGMGMGGGGMDPMGGMSGARPWWQRGLSRTM